MKYQREYWIDAVKVFACVLVALGHFFQSIVKSAIISESTFYQVFDQSIYTFHVPLFFICSGYLYQKFSNVNSLASWKRNILKKLISLGIPYVFFSIVTWGLKSVFSSYTNTSIGGLFDSLVLFPISPYWYLYCLFFIFVITPTFANQKMANCFLIAALAMKIVSLHYSFNAYALRIVFTNEIWFVLGMYACKMSINHLLSKKHSACIGAGCVLTFFASCIFIVRVWSAYEQFLLGFCACIGIILLAGYIFKDAVRVNGIRFLSKYTMPVFLMHTLFAAPWRSLLLKVGIVSPAVHIITGILVSFVGPIIAAEIMVKFKWTDFLLYPQKYITINKSNT